MTSSAGTFYVKLLHSHTETWLKMIEARDAELQREARLAEGEWWHQRSRLCSFEWFELADKRYNNLKAQGAPASDVQGEPEDRR